MERVSSWECKPSANERWTESEIQVVMPMCRPDLQQIYTLWENLNVSKVKGELDANNSPEIRHTHRYGSKKCRAEPRRMWNWIYPKKGCIPKSNGFKPHFPIKLATISGRHTPYFHKPDMNFKYVNRSNLQPDPAHPGPVAVHQTWSFQAPHL